MHGGLLLASAVLAGCGGDEEPAQPLGGPGVEASVGDIELRNIRLDNPPADIYEIGSAALLGVAMVSEGGEDDRLVGVSGPDFTGVAVEEGPPGTEPAIPIPAGGTVFTDGPNGPVPVLAQIDETLRSSESCRSPSPSSRPARPRSTPPSAHRCGSPSTASCASRCRTDRTGCGRRVRVDPGEPAGYSSSLGAPVAPAHDRPSLLVTPGRLLIRPPEPERWR